MSANLRVYVMALEVDSSELLRVLKPSLPLERLHLDSYNTLVSDATLELISQQYNKTLTHFLLLRDDPDFPDLSVNRNEDPLVLLTWRCTHLAFLVIHGGSRLFTVSVLRQPEGSNPSNCKLTTMFYLCYPNVLGHGLSPVVF